MSYTVRTQILNESGDVVAEQELPFSLVVTGFGEAGFGEGGFGGTTK